MGCAGCARNRLITEVFERANGLNGRHVVSGITDLAEALDVRSAERRTQHLPPRLYVSDDVSLGEGLTELKRGHFDLFCRLIGSEAVKNDQFDSVEELPTDAQGLWPSRGLLGQEAWWVGCGCFEHAAEGAAGAGCVATHRGGFAEAWVWLMFPMRRARENGLRNLVVSSYLLV